MTRQQSAAIIAVCFFLIGGSSGHAQLAPRATMFGFDVGFTLASFRSDRLFYGKSEFSDLNRPFLGSATGASIWGSATCELPTADNQRVALSFGLYDYSVSREGDVPVPCWMYDTTKKAVAMTRAMAHMRYRIDFTTAAAGAQLEVGTGRFMWGGGPQVGYPIASRYQYASAIFDPDSCFYNYFSPERTRQISKDIQHVPLGWHFSIVLRIAFLVPVASNVFLAPSIGADINPFPIDESGTTVSVVRPGIGLRYAR